MYVSKLGQSTRNWGVDACDTKAIADYWGIEEYLTVKNAGRICPNRGRLEAIQGWQIYFRTTSEKGSAFISAEDGTVCMVKGLFSTWAEMLGEAPVLLDAVLIPFQGSIISDGLVMPYLIYFGKCAREDFKDAYMNAKETARSVSPFK